MKLTLWCLGVLVAAVISGVQVVRNAHEVRSTHVELEATADRYNALLDENTRLLLERGAHASFSHVEQLAAEELRMQFPLAESDVAQAAPADGVQ